MNKIEFEVEVVDDKILQEEEKSRAKTPKYQYGEVFEFKLMYLLLSDRSFYLMNKEALKPEYFSNRALYNISRRSREYAEKYDSPPSKEVLKSIIKTEYRFRNEIDQYLRIVDGIFNVTRDDSKYVADEALKFGRNKAVVLGIGQGIDLIEKGKEDEAVKILRDAVNVGTTVLSLGHDFFNQFKERRSTKKREPIGTLLKELDTCLKGGLGRGELGVLLGSSGRGKTTNLVAFGKAALYQGNRVLHITLEMSEEAIAFKYEAAISGIDLDKLDEQSDEVYKLIDKCKTFKGDLYIKSWPTKMCTYSMLASYIEYFNSTQERKVDMVLIDYPDLMNVESDVEWLGLSELYV